MRDYLVILGLLVFLSACSSVGQSLVVSGETLKATGNEFVKVAAVYKNGCDVTKKIAPADCQKFRVFGKQFQESFPLAVQLWESARAANDAATQQKVEAVIVSLASTLSAFAVDVLSTFGGK